MKTTLTRLPHAVTRYLAAANQADAHTAVACFAANAVVHDEDRDHPGREAIYAWLVEVSRKYQPTLTVVGSSIDGNEVHLDVAIAGQFPGSPVTLDFAFRLRDGKIAELSIE